MFGQICPVVLLLSHAYLEKSSVSQKVISNLIPYEELLSERQNK